jgi:hypothetical protein
MRITSRTSTTYDVYVTWSGNVYKPQWGILLSNISATVPGLFFGVTKRHSAEGQSELVYQLPVAYTGPYSNLNLVKLKVGDVPRDPIAVSDIEALIASVPLDKPGREQCNWISDCLKSICEQGYNVKPCSSNDLRTYFEQEIVRTVAEQYGGQRS